MGRSFPDIPERQSTAGRSACKRRNACGGRWNQRSMLLCSFVHWLNLCQGSRGPTVFVTLQKDVYNEKGLSITDRRTLAYMKEKPQNPLKHIPGMVLWWLKVWGSSIAKTDHEFIKQVVPTSIMLFRYSAVTFNSHKIHFDYKYATEVEGYPGNSHLSYVDCPWYYCSWSFDIYFIAGFCEKFLSGQENRKVFVSSHQPPVLQSTLLPLYQINRRGCWCVGEEQCWWFIHAWYSTVCVLIALWSKQLLLMYS